MFSAVCSVSVGTYFPIMLFLLELMNVLASTAFAHRKLPEDQRFSSNLLQGFTYIQSWQLCGTLYSFTFSSHQYSCNIRCFTSKNLVCQDFNM